MVNLLKWYLVRADGSPPVIFEWKRLYVKVRLFVVVIVT